jgi:hypothetical protein
MYMATTQGNEAPEGMRVVVWTSSRTQRFTDAQLEAMLADPRVEVLSDGRFRRTTYLPK